MKLTFNSEDIKKISLFYKSNLNQHEMENLISKFPKLFCKWIRDYQNGLLTHKTMNLSHMQETISLEADTDKIFIHIEKPNHSRNFSKKFQHLIEDLQAEMSSTNMKTEAPSTLSLKKNLLECGFNPQVLQKINESLKEEKLQI